MSADFETDVVPDCTQPVSQPSGRRVAGQDPAKRKQIIDGARRVFIDMGFDAASMNDITREAGVSKGTIYVYFTNKEELFEAMIDQERGGIFANLYDSLNSHDHPRDALIAFGIGLATKINSHNVMLAQRTVIGVCERIPELGTRFYERGPLVGHQKIMAFLKTLVESGLLAIDDPDLAAYQLVDLCLAGVFRQRLFGYRTEPPAQDEVTHIVTSGVDVFLKAYGTAKLSAL